MQSTQGYNKKHPHDRLLPSDRIAGLKMKNPARDFGRAHLAIFNLPSKPIFGCESSLTRQGKPGSSVN